MKRQLWIGLTLVVATLALSSARETAAQYAAEVISYNAGTTPASGYTNAATALGSPERFTGEGVFPGVVSPFNPPFLTNELVSVGETGHLTLRLSNYAIPQPGNIPEIGVFSNSSVIDQMYPAGLAGDLSTPAKIAANTFGIDSALVEVSDNGVNWFSLGDTRFEMFSNGYLDVTDLQTTSEGSLPSDYRQPFAGHLSDFSGLKYSDAMGTDILDVLAGSGGGTWLDISGTGLAKVGYIRFSVPAGASGSFELDAVSISHAALGGATVPEPATLVLVAAAVGLTATSRRNPRRAE